MLTKDESKKLHELSDGKLLDLLHEIMQEYYGLTIEEWIEHEYIYDKSGMRAILEAWEIIDKV